MSAGRRVLIHVQHLKGIGHLRRAAGLARALADAGMRVTLVSGGMPVPGIDAGRADAVQLPPMRAAGEGYTALVDASGAPIDDGWRARRRGVLLEVLDRVRPHVLVLESFPFGRRKLRFELLPLLDRARALTRPPLVVSSLRDVPEPRADAAERAAMVELAEHRVDRLLVHGDPSVVRLEDTFPEAARLLGRTHYTGYLIDAGERGRSSVLGRGEVLVSAGGGAAGDALLRAAVEAARESRRPWRVLVGPNAPPALLDCAAPAGTVVEPNREDFQGLLRNCLVSLSQAGYNTMVELAQARCRALVVPHERGGEREQGIRARLFAARGLVQVLGSGELGPRRLAAAVERAAAGSRPPAGGLACDGAPRSVELIEAWARSGASPGV